VGSSICRGGRGRHALRREPLSPHTVSAPTSVCHSLLLLAWHKACVVVGWSSSVSVKKFHGLSENLVQKVQMMCLEAQRHLDLLNICES
jgi:hypothetical protein